MPKVYLRNDSGIKMLVEVSEEIAQQISTGQKYFVLAKGIDDHYVPVEVTEAVYRLFEEEYRFRERLRNEQRSHLDDRALENYTIICQVITEYLEDTYVRRERLAAIYAVLQACTPIQRERFILNRVYEYKCTEIAKMQESSPRRVRRSVEAVLKKLKKYL